MKKRILALFLSVTLLCTFFVQALPVASAADVAASGSCGENLTWTLDSEGLLTISGTGEMDDYVSSDFSPWKQYVVKTVRIEKGVTSIGKCAFSGCTGLTSVTIGNSVTSIGSQAFSGCTGLTSVTIGNSVTSIGKWAFYGCASLTSVTIPNSVTSIGYYAFEGCTGLTSVTIGNSVTSVSSYAFRRCTGLTSITIPDSVTSIDGSAFKGCTDLTSVTIGNSVTSIGDGAFEGCASLTSVTIGNSVTSIGNWAFKDCACLGSVTIPDSVTSIGEWAFSGCFGLTGVTIPDSVTSIDGSAFSDCTGLTAIIVDFKNPNYFSDASGVLFNKDKTELVCYPRGKTGSYTIPDSVTSIGKCAFSGCTGLTGVTIPDSVTSIGENAFYGCTGLTSVTIPNSVTSIGGYAFSDCSGLTSVIIPNSVTSIGEWAFSFCWDLTSVTIPDSVTSIDRYAFCGCTGLTGVYFRGDAPSIAASVFVCWDDSELEYDNIPGLTLYYIEGKSGWTTPTWGEDKYPTATWDGVNIPQPPHEHSYTAAVTAPTCTEKGYTTYTCAICGNSYGENFVDALGHDFQEGTCSRCGTSDPEYRPNEPTPTVEFNDVPETAWYGNAVNYAVSNKLMNGTGNGKFEPDSSMTRAMLVTVLWRYAGSPAEGTNSFTDVAKDQWYTGAVAWASSNGVVNGVGEGKFAPRWKNNP